MFAKVGRTRISMFLHGAVGAQAMMFFRCNNTVTACFELKRDQFVERVALIAGVEKKAGVCKKLLTSYKLNFV